MLPGDPHDIGAQRLGEHLHAANLELDELLVLEGLAAVLARLRQLNRLFAGGVANAEAVGGQVPDRRRCRRRPRLPADAARH